MDNGRTIPNKYYLVQVHEFGNWRDFDTFLDKFTEPLTEDWFKQTLVSRYSGQVSVYNPGGADYTENDVRVVELVVKNA